MEWVIVGLSAIAVTGIIGFLLVDAVMDSGSPPAPVVQLHTERAYVIPTGWMLPTTARNIGDWSASGLSLVASATVNGEPEDTEVSVDYLPGSSQAEITFGFSAEPEGEIEVLVSGFVR